MRYVQFEGKLDHFGYNDVERVETWCEKNNYKYAWICHDKDESTDAHIHCYVDMGTANRTVRELSKTLQIDTVNIQKVKNWAKSLGYITHLGKPNKHQYLDTEVHSNFEWLDFREECNPDVTCSQTVRVERGKFVLSQYAYDLITNDEIRPWNSDKYFTCEEYVSVKQQLNSAFDYRRKQLRNGGSNRKMNVYFLEGPTGTGKTTFAKTTCEGLKWSYYVSSGGKNPLDGYEGQDAIILDDLRDTTYDFIDLLKLLDNHTSSDAHARFYDKNMFYLKAIFVTSSVPLNTWYRNTTQESRMQLYRRISVYIRLDVDYLHFYQMNAQINGFPFVPFKKSVNPTKALFTPDTSEALGYIAGSLNLVDETDDNEFVDVDDNDVPNWAT